MGKPRHIRGLKILHEDDDIIVIEKEAGILTCATRTSREFTIEDALNDYVRKGQSRSRKCVYLVHRLDRFTSGVMMVVKTERARDILREHWNELTEKTYLARIEGKMDSENGAFESYLMEDPKTFKVRSIKNPQFGKFARTEWRQLETDGITSLMEVHLKSGRKNQIRVHFAEAGHPIVGDTRYGKGRGGRERLCLHSLELKLKHPISGEELTFRASPPQFQR